MKKRIYNQTSIFGPLYAYLVVISPPQAIKDDIARIKRELNAVADINDRNLHSIAHITLIDKLTDEADFADTVASFISRQEPFTVKLEEWNIFDHGHSVTLYIPVENPDPVINLAMLLKSASKSPHISLAKRMPYETFKKFGKYQKLFVFCGMDLHRSYRAPQDDVGKASGV